MFSPRLLCAHLSLTYSFDDWYILVMSASAAGAMACYMLLSQPWRMPVILIETANMIMVLAIFGFDGYLSDLIRSARSDFANPAFIMQSAIILLSMTRLGKIIESGRGARVSDDSVGRDTNRVLHYRSPERIPGVVS